jgi:hypothetical protein
VKEETSISTVVDEVVTEVVNPETIPAPSEV